MDYKIYSKLKDGVDCSYELGIWSEINSFIEYNNRLFFEHETNFSEIEEKYVIEINMNEYSIENANNLFKKLVSFLEYNHLTYYEKACFEDNTEYAFFS